MLTPEEVEMLCHWKQFSVNHAEVNHRLFHFADMPGQTGICPYFVVAEIMRGNSDPRDIPNDALV